MPELTSPHPIGEHAPQQSDLPAPPRAHALTLENRARLTVTGVTRIVSCDELGATLQTPLGDLTIGGQGMQVSELSVRTGEVHISGPWTDRKSTRLNSSHSAKSRMPSSA